MKQEKWFVAAKKADFEAIGRQFSIDPVLARIVRNRDVEGIEEVRKYLFGTLADLYPPERLKDASEAAQILCKKIREKKKIRIIGDYDIDGIMSTYILLAGLEMMGASVDMVIPHRVQDGYGLNISLVQEALESGIDTILTCDNGIAAYEQIAFAKKNHMTVIVTDHHEVPYEEDNGQKNYRIPQADAVVNPKQHDCPYPYKGICGAVTAMKLMQVLFEKTGAGADRVLDEFLDMAAFATVGDVMELNGENRILVKYGLKALEHTKNPGMAALIELCDLKDRHLSPYHVGFILGPCFNATGRLDTAKRALELLRCKSREEAVPIAMDLKHLNESRKEMTMQGTVQAEEQIQKENMERRRVFVLYLPQCHESIAGIVAGRIREKYGRPVFVLTDSGDEVKGSGRSIEAYSMYEEISKCKDLFTKYGGHKMAAGLSLPREKVEEFSRRLEENCTLKEEELAEKIHIDMAMPLSYVTRELIEQFELLEPFGNGNRRPLFVQKNLLLTDFRILGKNKNVGRYFVKDEQGNSFALTFFGQQETLCAYWREKGKIHVTYYPQLNTFCGKTEIQFVIQNYL